MEPSMQLPPPAPPDAFCLDEDVGFGPASDAQPAGVPLNNATNTGVALDATTAAMPTAPTKQEHDHFMVDQQQKQLQQQHGDGAITSPVHAPVEAVAFTADQPAQQVVKQQQQLGTAPQQLGSSESAHQQTNSSPQGISKESLHNQGVAAPAGPQGDGQNAAAKQATIPSKQQQQEPQQQHEEGVHATDEQQEQHFPGRSSQPRDLSGVISQLSDNAEAIAAAEEALRGLLARQATLHQLGRKMEQQQVLMALQQHLGFDKGRPVAAVLLYRCLQHWGLLHQTEPCPFLEQLSILLQQQLDCDDDASAPAEVAGLQCRVANSLTLCAVLYCVLLKAAHPAFAAAALEPRGPKQLHHSAAEVVAAARKKVSATWQQGVAHMGPGLQALGKLKLSGWGFSKRSDEAAAPAAPAAVAGSRSSSTSSQEKKMHSSAEHQQHQHEQLAAAATEAAAAAAAGNSSSSRSSPTPAASMDSLHGAAPLDAFLLGLDGLVQHAFILLRDQLKRRLTPLLADCVSPENYQCVMPVSDMTLVTPAGTEGGVGSGGGAAGEQGAGASAAEPISPTMAGAAVGGSAAASHAHAQAALMTYRSWSELVGVLHAALVALRAAHVPRALRAELLQQVLEFVNCQLFNQLLLRPECCSVSNARYALRGLKQLDSWIIAEQSASHHDTAHPGRQRDAKVSAVGSIHSSFTNTAAPAAAAAEPAGDSSPSSRLQQQQGPQGSPVAASGSPPAAAAKAAAEEDDGGWEQVPADTGEFDTWQPPKHQQQQQLQQQPWWRQLKQPQQQEPGIPGEQPELGPEAWNALAHVRQALQFLVFDSKGALSLEDLTEHVCPALNHQQLYRLCTTAWSEEAPGDAPETGVGAGGGGVSGEVLEQMKQLYTLSGNGGLIVTFLLDEPSGPLPFVQQQQRAGAAAMAAAGSSGRCKPSAVVLWDDGRDYGVGLRPLPGELVDEGCPAEVFEFLTGEQPWPPGRPSNH